MKFDKNLHQKIRYQGQLYVVILEEFPDYYNSDSNFKMVVHPISNDWIVHISNRQMREFMTIRKGDSREVLHHTKE